jgi:23S rRNA pseudouridine955/2504/2580 synthase
MFLHASRTVITHPQSGALLAFEAPLPPELRQFIEALAAPETQRAP